MRRNCFGVRRPRRAPTPPAGTSTATRGPPARLGIAWPRLLSPGPREDYPSGRGLQHAGHHDIERLADEALATLDDHHRAVREVSHSLARLLALAHDVDQHSFPGQRHRPHRVGEI